MQFLLRLEVAKCQKFPRPYRGELFPPSKPSVPLPPSHPQDKFQFLKKLVISKNLLKKLGFWDTPPPPLPSRGLRNPQVEWIFQNIILVSPMGKGRLLLQKIDFEFINRKLSHKLINTTITIDTTPVATTPAILNRNGDLFRGKSRIRDTQRYRKILQRYQLNGKFQKAKTAASGLENSKSGIVIDHFGWQCLRLSYQNIALS